MSSFMGLTFGFLGRMVENTTVPITRKRKLNLFYTYFTGTCPSDCIGQSYNLYKLRDEYEFLYFETLIYVQEALVQKCWVLSANFSRIHKFSFRSDKICHVFYISLFRGMMCDPNDLHNTSHHAPDQKSAKYYLHVVKSPLCNPCSPLSYSKERMKTSKNKTKHTGNCSYWFHVM